MTHPDHRAARSRRACSQGQDLVRFHPASQVRAARACRCARLPEQTFLVESPVPPGGPQRHGTPPEFAARCKGCSPHMREDALSHPIHSTRLGRAVVLVAAGCAFAAAPAVAGAAPVNLGTASLRSSVLGGSAVTNTGPSVLNGDLGVSPGTALTGFNAATVNGATHNNDAVAAQAQSDLTTAYNVAAGSPVQRRSLRQRPRQPDAARPASTTTARRAQLTGTAHARRRRATPTRSSSSRSARR